MKHINELFDNLDTWRNLPAYQLERRADIFFSVYLSEILSYKFGVNIDGLIPEFPIRKPDTNQSFKVDYLAKAKDINTVYLVELKTDDDSLRPGQDDYLLEAKGIGLARLLDGVFKIYQASISSKKYQYLLERLQEMGFITHDNSGAFRIAQADYNIQIVYIRPNNPRGQENVITFREISKIVERHEDELSLRFSKSLLKWADTKAGEV
jgi:hypothetical protein